jgi:hypothetical protein
VSRDDVRVLVQALGRLAGPGGAGPGEPVPGQQDLRTFHHLMSWKDAFLANPEKKEAIQVRCLPAPILAPTDGL